MEMFQKLKAKLAEELDSEAESTMPQAAIAAQGGIAGASGASASSQPALEREVAELKEHINKNYFVYVKRLEKRKERIRELEEYAKLLIKDNETLTQKMADFEDCQKQLQECRDNLEQLEGFQSQELSKVKHMLLSAETALDAETKERKRLQEEMDSYKHQHESDVRSLEQELSSLKITHQSKLDEMKKMNDSQVSRLEGRLSNQSLSGDDRLEAVIRERDQLDEELKSLRHSFEEDRARLEQEKEQLRGELGQEKARSTEVSQRLSEAVSERDSAKSQLLELEIAHHESQTNAGSEREKVKLDMAKVATEKETLEMTLDLRDKELKAKKEEFRRDLEQAHRAKEETTKEMQTKSVRITALEAELLHVKNKLSEESSNLLVATSNIDKLEASVQYLEETLQIKDKNVASIQKKLDLETQSASQLQKDYGEIKTTHEALLSEAEDLRQRNELLSKESEALKQKDYDANETMNRLQEETNELKATLADRDATFNARVERTELVRSLRRQIQGMEDDISDKKKLIRLHNQRVNDMKKTLQREMRGVPSSETNGRSPSPPTLSTSPSANVSSSSFDSPMTASQDLVLMSDTNFKYLKHIIFKFFTSKDYEAKHLTKAMAAVLQFTPNEEKLFQEHLDYKMSWFGSKPKMGSGSSFS